MRTNRLLAVAAIIALPTVASCGGDDDPAPVAEAATESATDAPVEDVETVGAEPGLVSPATAAALAESDGITVIDVRTPEEFAEGHIDGATLIDFYDESFAEQIAGLDPDGEYLIYCRSGNRSGQTFGLMAELGFDQVYDLDGGVLAYNAAGLPLSD